MIDVDAREDVQRVGVLAIDEVILRGVAVDVPATERDAAPTQVEQPASGGIDQVATWQHRVAPPLGVGVWAGAWRHDSCLLRELWYEATQFEGAAHKEILSDVRIVRRSTSAWSCHRVRLLGGAAASQPLLHAIVQDRHSKRGEQQVCHGCDAAKHRGRARVASTAIARRVGCGPSVVPRREATVRVHVNRLPAVGAEDLRDVGAYLVSSHLRRRELVGDQIGEPRARAEIVECGEAREGIEREVGVQWSQIARRLSHGRTPDPAVCTRLGRVHVALVLHCLPNILVEDLADHMEVALAKRRGVPTHTCAEAGDEGLSDVRDGLQVEPVHVKLRNPPLHQVRKHLLEVGIVRIVIKEEVGIALARGMIAARKGVDRAGRASEIGGLIVELSDALLAIVLRRQVGKAPAGAAADQFPPASMEESLRVKGREEVALELEVSHCVLVDSREATVVREIRVDTCRRVHGGVLRRVARRSTADVVDAKIQDDPEAKRVSRAHQLMQVSRRTEARVDGRRSVVQYP